MEAGQGDRPVAGLLVGEEFLRLSVSWAAAQMFAREFGES